MISTNLHLAKHNDGTPLARADIRVGIKVKFPSGAGGVLTHTCTADDGKTATFESTDPDWPSTRSIVRDSPDFTSRDFERLSTALASYGLGKLPTTQDREMVRLAAERGYASTLSQTQAHWTEEGLAAKRELEETLERASQSAATMNQLLSTVVPCNARRAFIESLDRITDADRLFLIEQHLTPTAVRGLN